MNKIMNKRLLRVCITLCMILTVLTLSNRKASAVRDEPFQVLDREGVSIGYYMTPAEAISAIGEGYTLKLLRDYRSNIDITNDNNFSFKLDLNGHVINNSSNFEPTITHSGGGTLTIIDDSSNKTGKVTTMERDFRTTILSNGIGNLCINGATVENTSLSGYAIINNEYNESYGNVTITGGKVYTTDSSSVAIMNQCNGDILITGGEVYCLGGSPFVIENCLGGNITILGGTVYTTSSTTMTIYNTSNGKITIGGSAIIRGKRDNSYGAIVLASGNASDTVLEITGGLIENENGTAIYYLDGGSGKINIPSGTAIIRGSTSVMNRTPDLSDYSGVVVTASVNYNGSDPVTSYNPSNIETYKYLEFEQGLLPSATPTVAVTTVNKRSAISSQVHFTLTNNPAYLDIHPNWRVYTSDTGSEIADGVSILNNGNTLTLSLGSVTDDLPTGTYYVSITETGKTESARLALTVGAYVADPDPTYGISLSTTGTHTFPSVNVGYGEQSALTVMISNTGNQPTGPLNLILSGSDEDRFTLNKNSIASIAASASDSFTIRPNTGLTPSTYTTAVTVSGASISANFNVSFTVNPSTPPDTPDPTPYYPPTPTPTPVPEGRIEKTRQQDEGAPTGNVNNSDEELKTGVLTPEGQEMVRRGEDAKIILQIIDISDSVSDKEKKLINEKLDNENSNEEKPILYIDLSLYKQIGDREQIRVTQTNGKISISIEVPESFWNTDITKSREFYIIRVHNNEAIRIDGSYDPETHMFTFETDSFSTYALSYQDNVRIRTYEGFRYLQLSVKADKSSQTISYKRFGGIDGYIIYGGECGQDMAKLVEVPANITSYTFKNLKQRTFYKYQVKAYRIIDGEQVVIMTSKVVHSIVGGKTYADPTRATLDVTSLKLTVSEDKTMTGQIVLPKGKKLKAHTAVIRYESSNKDIAIVNSKGKVIAKAEGTCYVYAYAQNGVYTRIKVIVK